MKENQLIDFEEICKPVVDWFRKNGSSHSSIPITDISAQFLSSELGVPFELNENTATENSDVNCYRTSENSMTEAELIE